MTDTERKAYYKELAREERRLARSATNPMVAKVHFQIATCYDEISSSRTKEPLPLRPLARTAHQQPGQVATVKSAPTAPLLMPQVRKH